MDSNENSNNTKDDKSSQGKSRDVAASVFNNINLLSIKRSVRLLLELESGVIEDFVKKYSGIMIFLLNILDPARSHELLNKLTDSSIVYIIEEELRFLLIREVALVTDNVEVLLALTEFLELVDSPRREEPVRDPVRIVLAQLIATRSERKKTHFAYIDALPLERRKKIDVLLMERNDYAALGMLAYSSEEIVCTIIDGFCGANPQALSFVPDEIMLVRFHRDYQPLLHPSIIKYLSKDMVLRIEEVKEVKERYRQDLELIEDLSESKEEGARNRGQIMNLVYRIIKELSESVTELILQELKQKGVLGEQEIYILNEMSKVEESSNI